MKKLVCILSGLVLWSAGQIRAEETEKYDSKEPTFSMNIQIRPRAE